MIKNSTIHRFILSRPQAMTVISEEDDPGRPLPGGETYDAVILTIKLNDRSSQ